MDTLDPGTRPLCHNLLDFGAGTDVTERRANPLQPALGVRMTFVARPHTPSNNNTGWEGGLIFQNQKLGWEGGKNPIIFQNTKFPKITTVTTTDFFPTFFPQKIINI